eukprot:jgi/Botrbrau1/13830/Bobra.0056s0071.2
MGDSEGAPRQSLSQSEGPGVPPQSVPSKSPDRSASTLRPSTDFLEPTAEGLRQHPSQAGQSGRPRVPRTDRLTKEDIEAARKKVEDPKIDPQRRAVAEKELAHLYKRYDKLANRKRLYNLKKIEPKHIAAAQAEVNRTRENMEANAEARALLEYCLKRQKKEQKRSDLQKIKNAIEDAKKEVEEHSDDQKRAEAQSKLDKLQREYAAHELHMREYGKELRASKKRKMEENQRACAQRRTLEQQIQPGQLLQQGPPGQPLQQIQPGQLLQQGPPGQPLQQIQPGQLLHQIHAGQPRHQIQPGQLLQQIQAGQLLQQIQAGQLLQQIQPGQLLQQIQPGQLLQQIQAGQPLQLIHPGQPLQLIHPGPPLQQGPPDLVQMRLAALEQENERLRQQVAAQDLRLAALEQELNQLREQRQGPRAACAA